MPSQNRVLRRLDDGRVVFRLHPFAIPVLLSETDHQAVEALILRRFLCVVFLGLLLFALLVLYFQQVIPLVIALASGAFIMGVSVVVEAACGRPLRVLLNAAPIAEAEMPEHRPSIVEILGSRPRHVLRVLDDKALRSGIILFGCVFPSCGFVLVMRILGIRPYPETNPAILMLLLILSGVGLWFLIQERRRRNSSAMSASDP